MASAFILGFAAVPALWPPCAEPQDLHSLQVWASLCAEVSGARLASVGENLSGVSREGALSSEGDLGQPPHFFSWGRVLSQGHSTHRPLELI